MKIIDEHSNPIFTPYEPVSEYEELLAKFCDLFESTDGGKFILHEIKGDSAKHVCYVDEEKNYLWEDPTELIFSKKCTTDFTIATSNFLDFLALEKLKINTVFFTKRTAWKLAAIPVYYIRTMEIEDPTFPCSMISDPYFFQRFYRTFSVDVSFNEKRNFVINFVNETKSEAVYGDLELPYKQKTQTEIKSSFKKVLQYVNGDKFSLSLLLGWHNMLLYKEYIYKYLMRFPHLFLQANYVDIGLLNNIVDELFVDKGVVIDGYNKEDLKEFQRKNVSRLRVENFIDTFSTSLKIKHNMNKHYRGELKVPVILSSELSLQDSYLKKCTIISQYVDNLPKSVDVGLVLRDYTILNKLAILKKHIHNKSLEVTETKFWGYYRKFEELKNTLSKEAVGHVSETMENYALGFTFAMDFMDISVKEIVQYIKRVLPSYSVDPCMNLLGAYLYYSLSDPTSNFSSIIGGNEKELFVDFSRAVRELRQSGANVFMNEYSDLKVYLSVCPYFVEESFVKTYNGLASHLSILDKERIPPDIILLLDQNCDKYRSQFGGHQANDREDNRTGDKLPKLRFQRGKDLSR